jgi:hypothetical protein
MSTSPNSPKSKLTLDLKASGFDIAKAHDFATNPHRPAAGKLDLFRTDDRCGAISPVDHHSGSMLPIQFSDCGSYAP